MFKKISVSTGSRTEFYEITSKVEDAVKESKIKSGVCRLFVPHTTAGITINENADPSVKRDILNSLQAIVPFDAAYEHAEGNAAAHVKSTIVGVDLTISIENGALRLGRWQGIFFCEFDGPRQRNVFIDITER